MKKILAALLLVLASVPAYALDGCGYDTGVFSGVLSGNGAASAPVLHLNGSIYSGGSGTTTLPKLLISNPAATASSTWSTNGTEIGINATAAFMGRAFDLKLDGISKYIIGKGSVWSSPPSTSVLTGSIDPTASTTLTGVGTKFLEELMPGDKILVSGETRTVVAIASDTSLTVDTATTDTANDASVDRYPVGFSLTPADSSAGTDIFVNPAVKSSGNVIDLRVANTSVFSVNFSGQGTFAAGISAAGNVSVGTSLNSTVHYFKLDTLNADTAGAPATGDCDAAAEVGRAVVSTRYSATAEYRLWVCVQTGASTFAWYKSELTAP